MKSPQALLPCFYVDSSAYLAVLLGEPGHQPIAPRRLRRAEPVSSTLLALEVERNLVRLARESVLTETQFAVALDRF